MRALFVAMMLAATGILLPACTLAPSPAEVATRQYLEQARAAVRAQDGAQAMAALDAAESSWLVATQVRSNPIVHHEHPTLRDIGGARAAVRNQNWKDASYYINNALRHPGTLGA